MTCVEEVIGRWSEGGLYY